MVSHFLTAMKDVIPLLKPNSIIVMDNAHITSAWKKEDIEKWLDGKCVV